MVEEPENDRTAMGLGISGRPSSINRVPVGGGGGGRVSPMSSPTPLKSTFTPNSSNSNSPMYATFRQDIAAGEPSPGSIGPTPPGSSRPLLSPQFQRFDSGRPQYGGTGLDTMPEEDDISHGRAASYDEFEMRDVMNNDNNNDNDNDSNRGEHTLAIAPFPLRKSFCRES